VKATGRRETLPLARRVDARDVLDANAVTSRSFTGRVAGSYRRAGPNAWDDYVLVEEDGGTVEVLPGTHVQVEADGALFRMRRKGHVLVVSWVPGPDEQATGPEVHALFLERCIRHEDPTPDGSMGAWLHGELKPKSEAKD
jgi:hypothetical protein